MMDKSSNSTETKWGRRRRKFIRWGLAVLLVLLVLHVVMTLWSRSALNRVRKQMAESGESLEFRDFLPPEVPTEANASHFLEAITALLVPYRHEAGKRTTVDELTGVIDLVNANQLRAGDAELGEDELALLRAGVDRFDNLYRLFDEAYPRERARYGTTYSEALAIEYEVPPLIPRTILARLLEARAVLAIHEGRTDDAYFNAAGIFRLASWVDQETPAMISKLIVAGIFHHGCMTVNHLLQFTPPPPDAEALILEEMGRLDARAIFSRGIRFDRAVYFSTLIDPDLEDRASSAPAYLKHLGSYRSYVLLSAAEYCDTMTRLIRDYEPPAWQREPDPATEDDYHDQYASGFFSLVTRIVLPPYYHYSNRFDVMQARQDILALAFRLEAHRQAHGTYPLRLDEVGDPQPVDPFSGEPYRYRPVDSGYLLYSVAGNRVDDGGKPLKKPWKVDTGDLVWRIK